jgi:alkanesulfonate monooxygenase SsuD/methylene tetrahydromethanopterin reductase-like flavin-dependent oxidoreductase (luciferase family)
VKFGLLVTPGSHAPETVARAEALGFDSAFFLDSPVVFGDPYVGMAACAVQSKHILLATGVTNPRTRSAPVTASCLASLNALAPGRIMLGIGLGYTATLAMGERQAKPAELERFVSDVRGLLRGDVADILIDGKDIPVQFLNQSAPWLNLQDEIQIHIAASGPRMLPLAGRIGDAVILGGMTNPEIIDACRRYIERGAGEAGRWAEGIELSITPSVYVTQREPSFEHLREVLGPKSLSPALNFAEMARRAAGVQNDVVEDFNRVREAYHPGEIDSGDPRTRHLRTFRGYMTELKDWQQGLVTANVLDSTSIAGTVEQCIAKIRRLEQHGISRIIVSPLPQFVGETLETYGRSIIPVISKTETTATARKEQS